MCKPGYPAYVIIAEPASLSFNWWLWGLVNIHTAHADSWQKPVYSETCVKPVLQQLICLPFYSQCHQLVMSSVNVQRLLLPATASDRCWLKRYMVVSCHKWTSQLETILALDKWCQSLVSLQYPRHRFSGDHYRCKIWLMWGFPVVPHFPVLLQDESETTKDILKILDSFHTACPISVEKSNGLQSSTLHFSRFLTD